MSILVSQDLRTVSSRNNGAAAVGLEHQSLLDSYDLMNSVILEALAKFVFEGCIVRFPRVHDTRVALEPGLFIVVGFDPMIPEKEFTAVVSVR